MLGSPSAQSGFEGTVEKAPLEYLIQLACLAKTDLLIKVVSGQAEGHIIIRAGAVAHAVLGDNTGEQAILAILQWEKGSFDFDATPLSAEEEIPMTVNRPWEFLLIEAIRLCDLSRAAGTSKAVPRGEETQPDAAEGEADGFGGRIAAILVTDLIQFVCSSGLDYLVRFESDLGKGLLVVSSGRIIHAETESLQGEEAFLALVDWVRGSFKATVGTYEGAPTIDKPTEILLTDAMRMRDERAGGPDEDDEGRKDSLAVAIMKMKVIEKVKLATKGDKEARAILIRDPSKLIQYAIISNPRISEGEVTMMASSRSIDEEILRRIANNREWMKLYQIRLALASNPKTPVPISARLVPTLMVKDLKTLSKSRTVPTAVAQAAQRESKKHT
ncbi:MAG: DUF4388 domain-containing protein [Syntrophobacteraceae bacterium]